MAQLYKLRHNCATTNQPLRHSMPSQTTLFQTMQNSTNGISLAALLEQHPEIPRRTAQRWIKQWIENEKIHATGKGPARRYFFGKAPSSGLTSDNNFNIPLSADSKDILAYIAQPVEARKPVGYQQDFLESYQPNKTWYLPETLRRQLRKMGGTPQTKMPAGTYGRAIINRLLIDLSWASSHLEGNTYSLLDTRELIENGKAAAGKAAIETQMILNHKTAIELLVDNADSVAFNRFSIMNLHSALSENLLANPADEGRIRQHLVEIGKSVFRPLSVPSQINEMLDLLLDKVNQINDPFEQSFFMMVHLPYLQPFADINKRTSRLSANLPLIKANLCPLTFLGVPDKAYSCAILGVYELTRVELLRDLYVWAYERSTQEYLAIKQDLSEPDPLRLQYREIIKQTVNSVVTDPDQDTLSKIRALLSKQVIESDRNSIEALIIDELRRLHEGVLARYGLRPSQFDQWKKQQNSF